MSTSPSAALRRADNSRQHTRSQIDRAIGRSFAELDHLPFTRLAFANLLHQVRASSSLLRPTGDGSQQLLALEALRNIARHHDDFLNWPSSWRGGEGSVHALVHSLASHIFGRYPVPRCFGLVWFGGSSPAERTTRRWFIEHAHGRPFRQIPGLPMTMTRKMERILLRSPHHLPLRAAMRRAEILGLGGDAALVDTILATSLAQDLEHGDFWRSAMHFFVKYADELEPGQVHAIIDFLYMVRIQPLPIVSVAGLQTLPPPEPNFSMVGRTPASLLRLIEGKGGQAGSDAGLSWPSSGLPSMCFQDDVGEWRIFELLNSCSLQLEGQTLRHCVRTYWRNCVRRRSSIWSLRWRNADGNYAPRCTVEVRPRTRTIVQIRAYQNQRVNGRMREILEQWAALAELTIAEYAW